VEDGGGVTKAFDQLLRGYGTDTVDVGEGELIKGILFHGRIDCAHKVADWKLNGGRK
jgi:hypothetical protein